MDPAEISDVLNDLLSDLEDDNQFMDDSDNDPDYVNNPNNSEDSEVDEGEEEPVVIARPGNEEYGEWTDIDKIPDIDVFCEDSGVTDVSELDEHSTVLDFFNYFIDNDLLCKIKHETNLYAQQQLRKLRATNKLTAKSRMNSWKAISLEEIQNFLAISFHMCIDKKPQLVDHWSQDPVVSCNFCQTS
ncbi:uncharacterized protein LOC120351053 [Nilaparvata lugens]|uniref:uncharacterized protein LOC120351053 n=1 Tax=Nilaparvata lugens TaxID=108931 RepID=UPI00193DCB32|nr:uncharacterized protein LOC120351053 [Nilaparvata lugens]